LFETVSKEKDETHEHFHVSCQSKARQHFEGNNCNESQVEFIHASQKKRKGEQSDLLATKKRKKKPILGSLRKGEIYFEQPSREFITIKKFLNNVFL
jgi:hypothetical protein